MKKKLLFYVIILIVIAFGSLLAIGKEKTPPVSLRGKLEQLMIMDFKYWGKDKKGKNVPFTVMNPTVKRLLSKYQFGGIILFAENIQTLEHTIKLINCMQNAAKIPLLIGTDQEGGIVSRIKFGTIMPGNMILGAADNPNLTREVSKAMGEELNALGINIDFAPVVDVNSCPSNPVIGVRSFGGYPKLVAKMGDAFVKGLKEASVFSCAKHFPGHGNTKVDTHVGLATVHSSYEKLLKTDLKPFEMVVSHGVNAIMVAHLIVPALDNSKLISKKDGRRIGTPATFSKRIITGILRKKFKFNGLVITDALDMKAITDNLSHKDAVIKSILAGADIVLIPVTIREEKDISKLEDLLNSLVGEYNKNPNFRVRVNESLKRIIAFKKRIHVDKDPLKNRIKLANSIVGCKKHKQIAREASSKGITLIKNDNHILPFKLKKNSRILILDANPSRINTLSNSIRKISTAAKINKQLIQFDGDLKSSLKKKILDVDFTILLTYNLKAADVLSEQIARFANRNNKKLVTIACRNPYDISYIPSCKANFAIYGATAFDITNDMLRTLKINLEAVAKMLFVPPDAKRPLLTPKGKLPVEIIDPKTNKTLYNIGYGLTY